MEIYDVMNEKCICVSEPMVRVTVEAHRRLAYLCRGRYRELRGAPGAMRERPEPAACCERLPPGPRRRAARHARLHRHHAPARARCTPAPRAVPRPDRHGPPASAAALRTERISIFFAESCGGGENTHRAGGRSCALRHASRGFLACSRSPPSAETQAGAEHVPPATAQFTQLTAVTSPLTLAVVPSPR